MFDYLSTKIKDKLFIKLFLNQGNEKNEREKYVA